MSKHRELPEPTPRLWWLSFANEAGWLGGCIVEAYGFLGAVQQAWDRNINPGGEVLGNPIPKKKARKIDPRHINRLIKDEAELERLFGKITVGPAPEGAVCVGCQAKHEVMEGH